MSRLIHLTIAKQNRTTRPFILQTSSQVLDQELGRSLPAPDAEIYKIMSLGGLIASASFIKYVADKEPIEELTASTLRIGEKQFRYIFSLAQHKRVKLCRFFTSTLQKQTDKKSAKYNYFQEFERICRDKGWKNIVVNNHSKIILMRTKSNYYVLETSSNLNENPKIEQYSFENSEELYRFYYHFFDLLEAGMKA